MKQPGRRSSAARFGWMVLLAVIAIVMILAVRAVEAPNAPGQDAATRGQESTVATPIPGGPGTVRPEIAARTQQEDRVDAIASTGPGQAGRGAFHGGLYVSGCVFVCMEFEVGTSTDRTGYVSGSLLIGSDVGASAGGIVGTGRIGNETGLTDQCHFIDGTGFVLGGEVSPQRGFAAHGGIGVGRELGCAAGIVTHWSFGGP